MRNGKAYLNEYHKSLILPDNISFVSGHVLKLTAEQLWKVDQWKDVPQLERLKGTVELEGESVEVYYYSTITYNHDHLSPMENILVDADLNSALEEFMEKTEMNKLGLSDIYLMIPCSLKEYSQGYQQDRTMTIDQNSMAYHFITSVKESNDKEFSDDFIKGLSREVWGIVNLLVNVNEKVYTQPAIVTLTKHTLTCLGILIIMIPSVTVPGHHVLFNLRANTLRIQHDGGSHGIREWLETLGIRIFGTPRSVVFSSSEIPDEEILKALVTEATPMGKIIGSEFTSILNTNLAQYDTARVHASEVCLIELNNTMEENHLERISSQAIEIFFIELILLQDAAISRISSRIKQELDNESNNPGKNDSSQILDLLACETSQAVLFFDYNQFLFPTVRVAAENIANCFGMRKLLVQHNRYKEILEQLISIHKSRTEELENKTVNLLLLVLAMAQVVPVFYGIVKAITQGAFQTQDIFVSLYSIGICFSLWIFFTIFKWKSKSKFRNRRFPNPFNANIRS
ncbi:hypothetical protein [Desulfosporosinus burensis]